MKRSNMQIIKMFGILGERKGNDGRHQTLELNLLKWANGQPVYDIRWWVNDEPMYGLSFTEQTLAELGEMIDYIFSEENND